MRLAGIAVPHRDVLELALLLRAAGFTETAERLENAYDLETKILALTIAEREQIIRALDEAPSPLVLAQEHTPELSQLREGLA
jgi:hypothetical protein